MIQPLLTVFLSHSFFLGSHRAGVSVALGRSSVLSVGKTTGVHEEVSGERTERENLYSR